MNLIRYNPNSLDLLDNVSRWFDDLYVEPSLGRSVLPAVDVRETDADYLMEVELPGLSEKDVEVKLDNNLLRGKAGGEEERLRHAGAPERAVQPQLRSAGRRRP